MGKGGQTIAKKKDTPYTPAELERAAASTGKTLLAVDGQVLDVTNWVPYHPGGGIVLQNISGRDVSDAFEAFHPPAVRKRLGAFAVGTLVDDDAPSATTASGGKGKGSGVPAAPASLVPASAPPCPTSAPELIMADFRAMRARMHTDGMFTPRPLWHVALFLKLASLFAAGVGCVIAGRPERGVDGSGSVGLQMLGAVLIGVFWQQFALFSHDGCHNSLTAVRKYDYGTMIFGTCLLGISPTWWKDSHNNHHVLTNSVHHDQDIQHLPFMAVSDRFFGSIYSKYHLQVMAWDAFAKFMVSYQHILYLPVMAVARVNLYVQSLVFLAGLAKGVRSTEHRALERLSFALFFVWFGALAAQVPGWPARLAFGLITHAVSGVLHVQITISHFSMATRDDAPYGATSGPADNWVQWQLATTMDVDCHPWMDWVHGGLQYQIEHHLFPRMPRANLRRCMEDYVKPFCAKHGLHHHAPPFVGAVRETLDCLRVVALEARALPAGAVKLEGSALWEGANLQG